MTEQPDEQVTSLCNPEALVPSPDEPLVTSKVTEYSVSILDEEDINRSVFELKVAYRGRGKWAVKWNPFVLSADGEWDHEPMPSNRADEWIATHRFDELEALVKAREVAPQLKVNGITALEARRRWEERSD